MSNKLYESIEAYTKPFSLAIVPLKKNLASASGGFEVGPNYISRSPTTPPLPHTHTPIIFDVSLF